jgi:predicted Zn-dependent protease
VGQVVNLRTDCQSVRPALLLFLLLPLVLHAQPRAWQDTIDLRTYSESLPDLAPNLDVFSRDRPWYPYTTRNPGSARPTPQSWRRIHLENEYLACTFLPDLGGRLYTCADKLNGHPMFYANPVIKKGMGYTRNAFAALGVETSFPFAHGRDNVSPVDFAFRQDKDRASVWMSDTDRVTGMRWTVEFVLRAGRAILEENVTLSNPTSVRQPYQWWNNADIAVEPGSRFVIPTQVVSTHGQTDLDTWPVSSSGVDQSLVANVKDQLGLFAYQSREPFLAVYHAASKTATVHVADPAVVRGKKLWTWGTADSAGEAALVDDGARLIEIQAGLFADQETFEYLEPHQSRGFTEYWLPARQLGGISRADTDAVLNFARRGPALAAELNVTHAIPGARIRILNGPTSVLQESVNLEPGSLFTRTIPNPAAASYRFELLDAQGKLLLAYAEGPYDATPPSAVKLGPQPQANASPDDRERNGRLQLAENEYRAALEKSPADPQLKKALGRLLAVRKNFAEAAGLLADAAAALPQDAETRYYLAVAQAAEGNQQDAQRNWQSILEDPAFGSAAALEMAASQARSGHLQAALDVVSALLKRDPGNLEAGRMRVVLLRKNGMIPEARAQLAHCQSLAPFDSFLRMEYLWLIGPDDGLWPHLAADPQRVLDIAEEYCRLGIYNDSLPVLNRVYPKVPENQSEPGVPLPQADALVAYYRAYCYERSAPKPARMSPLGGDWRTAAGLPLQYVFPHRAGSFPVLRTAVRENPGDASAGWLLGLLDLDSGMVDDAIAEWQRARALPNQVLLLHELLARVLRDLKHDQPGALAVEEEAAKNRPEAAPPPSGAPGNPTSPPEIASQALLRAASGQLSSALAAFNAQNFPQDRQREDVRRAYIELQLLKLRAQAAGHRCNDAFHGLDTIGDEDKALTFTMYGFEGFMKSARFQYYLAGVESACGDQKAARKRLTKVARMTAGPATSDFAFPALSAAILNEAEGKPKLQAALHAVSAALAKGDSESKGALLYSQGLLLRALGQEDQAIAAFTEGSKAQDLDQSQYLNLLALHEQ